MDTTRGRPSLLWLRRLVVIAGLLLGGWLLSATSASADTGLADLAQELIDEAAEGGDIGSLINGAIDDVVPEAREPEPEYEPEYEPEPQQTSSASGSSSSTPGVEVRNTTTYGGSDYGPDPRGGSSGSVSNYVEPVDDVAATDTEAVVPVAKTPPRSVVPPQAEPAPKPAPVHRAQAPVPAPAPVVATSDSGERTAPADRPAEKPSSPAPAPSAPGSGSAAGSAHDGGGQSRGALGVLATRDHAAAPSGGWPMAYPQVLGAAIEAAGAPTSRPD